MEGWSCIGKWTGVPVSVLLQKVGLKPEARYLVFHCADTMENGADSADDNSGGDQSDNAGDQNDAGGKSSGTNGGMANESKGSQQAGTGGRQADAAATGTQKGNNGKSQQQVNIEDIGNGPIRYYESIDLEDAFHPQTILAYEMNGQTLPVAHGAPLRLRLERQLGYKMAKYIMRIEAVDSLDKFGQGGGGYWEDQGYEWYAGI